MKLFIQLISFFFFSKFIKAEKSVGLIKTKETSKMVSGKGASEHVASEHEDSSSGNDVIIKISENKKKKKSAEQKVPKTKAKKQSEKLRTGQSPVTPVTAVPDSTYQVPTSNILFKDLDTKKVEIPETDYKELVSNTKILNNVISGLQKILSVNNNIIKKVQNLNPDKENSKARDLFNIKVIEVSDDAKSPAK
ncbi:hypothetical protein NGRA_1745 [Nosema granulosis]|uniref:Uncharacterized protein n=1 Tax=Nosema granulosis TaxID=83296 RepID=A0A9P6GZG5_9MICR|nr:hypothetical protein NGRA_1745 [Nosema granulosis]